MLERNERLGGAPHVRRPHAPGFTHELMASWHPLFAGSAAYAELGDDLHRHGLEYLNTDLPTATLFPDGGAAFLTTSLEDNVAEFERTPRRRRRLGDAVRGVHGLRRAQLRRALGTELWSTQGSISRARRTAARPARAARVRGQHARQRRDWLGATFASERAHGLLAPWVLHTGLGPEQAVVRAS